MIHVLWCCLLIVGGLAAADGMAQPEDWSAGGAVLVVVPTAGGERWLDADMRLADHRWFSVADPVRVPPGEGAEVRLPLVPSRWAGDGRLGPDALAQVTGFRPVLRDSRGAVLSHALAWRREPGGRPVPQVLRPHDGVRVDRGPWHEVRWRLHAADGAPVEDGEVDVVDAAERRRPAFLAQPGLASADGWRARGPAVWVLRLSAGESAPGPWSVAWRRDGTALALAWSPPETVRRVPLPAGPDLPLAPPAAPSVPEWLWSPAGVRAEGIPASGPSVAPVLCWVLGAWGSRGPALTGHARAAAEDVRLAGGAEEIDLLPAWLGGEQGVFRAGASPWAAAEGPAALLSDEARVAALRRHQREVVARSRAAPGLRRWRFGLRSALEPEGEARLQRLVGDVAAWLADHDGRPLATDHPAVGLWERTDQEAGRRPVWEDFAAGTGGWRGVFAPARTAPGGSDGGSCLVLTGDPALGSAGAVLELDAPLWNLDQIRADVRIDGAGAAGATWFAWLTDDGHRWYQRRIGWVPGVGRWTALTVPMDGAWLASGHGQPWHRDRLRRVRRIGFSAYVHGATGPWTAGIDRLRRFGWPRLDRIPAATVAVSTVPPGTVRPWSPVRLGLAVAPDPFNPYDPASADVGCTIRGPDGRERFWPAAWIEPRTLAIVDGREQVSPAGPGGWTWTFAPTATGTWQIRPEARIRWRDRTLAATGAWLAVAVDGRPEVLQPIRVSPRDPAWFETADGAFFYPVGVNLRSPGDDRQDRLLGASGPPARWVLPAGWRSASVEALGTAAYDHWFKRSRDAGMNWARVWMAPWWCGLEWRRDWPGFNGIGWYNQDAAARLDRICDLAETHGMHLQIELQNHGMTSPLVRGSGGGRGVDSQWRDSPWYERNGGPFEHPAETFAEGAAWTGLANRHRYVLARWGWRTAIAAWVLSSELEFTGAWEREARGDLGRSPTTNGWIRRNLDWFSAHDPQRRPVSIHFSHPWAAPDVWRIPGLGFNNSNAYTAFQPLLDQLGGGDADLARACEHYLKVHFPPWDLGRPTIIGEWGGHWSERDPAVLREEVLHGPWIQAVLPFAGNTGFWWWLWLDAEDRWSAFAAPSRFARSADPRGAGLRPVPVSAPAGIRGVAAAGPGLIRAYVWNEQPGAAGQVRVEGVADGPWDLTGWSMAGEPEPPRRVQIRGGFLILSPGPGGRRAYSAVPCPDPGPAGVSLPVTP